MASPSSDVLQANQLCDRRQASSVQYSLDRCSSFNPTCLCSSPQLLTCTVPDHAGLQMVAGREARAQESPSMMVLCELPSLLSGLAGVIADSCSVFPCRMFQFLVGFFSHLLLCPFTCTQLGFGSQDSISLQTLSFGILLPVRQQPFCIKPLKLTPGQLSLTYMWFTPSSCVFAPFSDIISFLKQNFPCYHNQYISVYSDLF